jgi:hypothetical protein
MVMLLVLMLVEVATPHPPGKKIPHPVKKIFQQIHHKKIFPQQIHLKYPPPNIFPKKILSTNSPKKFPPFFPRIFFLTSQNCILPSLLGRRLGRRVPRLHLALGIPPWCRLYRPRLRPSYAMGTPPSRSL